MTYDDYKTMGSSADDLLARYKTMRSSAEDLLKVLDAQIRHKAGVLFDELKENRDLCKHIVESSPDVGLRWAAIQLLLRHRGIDSDTAAFCRSTALDMKQDTKIRCVALRGLYNRYESTGDATVGKLFAVLIRDGSQDARIVRACYFNILDMLAVPYEERPSFSRFKVEDDIETAYLSQWD